MTVVSSGDGVMGAEERCEEKNGHTSTNLFFKSKSWFEEGLRQRQRQQSHPIQISWASSLTRLETHGEAMRTSLSLSAMRTSLSFSVIFMPGWSRKNRISEAGSLEEYTPLT
jgi:hypothetical protein